MDWMKILGVVAGIMMLFVLWPAYKHWSVNSPKAEKGEDGKETPAPATSADEVEPAEAEPAPSAPMSEEGPSLGASIQAAVERRRAQQESEELDRIREAARDPGGYQELVAALGDLAGDIPTASDLATAWPTEWTSIREWIHNYLYSDRTEPEVDAEQSFAKAHYEQHCAVTGTIRVGDEVLVIDGLGLRDKSWGPRHWQAIDWYRWLPITFSHDFGMMISVVSGRPGGMVLVGDEYHLIRDCTIESDWDADGYQTGMRCTVHTDHDTYAVTGEVLSLIPLRNRRTAPDGTELMTRITEAMTRYECDGRRGIGMSEYLDQIVDGRPVGPDVR